MLARYHRRCETECDVYSRCEVLRNRASQKEKAQKEAGVQLTKSYITCPQGPTLSGEEPTGTPVGNGFDCHARTKLATVVEHEASGNDRVLGRLVQFIRSMRPVN